MSLTPRLLASAFLLSLAPLALIPPATGQSIPATPTPPAGQSTVQPPTTQAGGATVNMLQDRVCTDKLPLYYLPIEPIPPGDRLLGLAGLQGLGSVATFDKLTEQGTRIAVFQVEQSLKLTYLVATASTKNTIYKVFHDSGWYRTVVEPDTDNKPLYYYRIGVAIRVVADFTALDAKLNLSGLSALGIEGGRKKVVGTLDTRAIGLQGRDIPIVLPSFTEFTPESLAGAVQAVTAMKARVWDGVHVPIVSSALDSKVTGTKDLETREKEELIAALSFAQQRNATQIIVEPRILAIGMCPTETVKEGGNEIGYRVK